jgi:hypothetical protein
MKFLISDMAQQAEEVRKYLKKEKS